MRIEDMVVDPTFILFCAVTILPVLILDTITSYIDNANRNKKETEELFRML